MKRSRHPDELPYNKETGKLIREWASNGVSKTQVIALGQAQDPMFPKSWQTFNKMYRADYEAGLADTSQQIGSKVVNQAKTGDDDSPNTWKARELYLRSHAGWSPKTTEESREVGSEEEETESAVDALLKALGKDTEKDS